MIDHHKTKWTPVQYIDYSVKHVTKSYVGQTGRSTEIRHREHIRYIKTNNPISAYACTFLIIDLNMVVWTYHEIIKCMQKRKGNELLGIILHASATIT